MCAMHATAGAVGEAASDDRRGTVRPHDDGRQATRDERRLVGWQFPDLGRDRRVADPAGRAADDVRGPGARCVGRRRTVGAGVDRAAVSWSRIPLRVLQASRASARSRFGGGCATPTLQASLRSEQHPGAASNRAGCGAAVRSRPMTRVRPASDHGTGRCSPGPVPRSSERRYTDSYLNDTLKRIRYSSGAPSSPIVTS